MWNSIFSWFHPTVTLGTSIHLTLICHQRFGFCGYMRPCLIPWHVSCLTNVFATCLNLETWGTVLLLLVLPAHHLNCTGLASVFHLTVLTSVYNPVTLCSTVSFVMRVLFNTIGHQFLCPFTRGFHYSHACFFPAESTSNLPMPLAASEPVHL